MASGEESEYDWGDFVVVRAKINGKNRYECIPSTWLVFDENCSYQTTVTFQFPSTEKFGKGIKFPKDRPPNKNWPDYIGKMLLDTDSQGEAFQFIQNAKARVKKLSLEMGDYSSSSVDPSESDSEEENSPEQSGMKRKQAEKLNSNILAKSKKDANAEDEIGEPHTTDSAKQIHSRCNNFYEEFNTSYKKSMSNLNNIAGNLRKIMSTYKATLVTSITSRNLNEDDDDTPDDTTWTLRYPEPGLGIKELIPNTNVYVSEKDLNECQIKYTTPTKFTKGVLELVFTDEAMRSCSLTGQAPSRQESENLPTRPGLDPRARETFVAYVEQYCIEKGWLNAQSAYRSIMSWARNKLSEEYQKSKKPPKSRSSAPVVWEL